LQGASFIPASSSPRGEVRMWGRTAGKSFQTISKVGWKKQHEPAKKSLGETRGRSQPPKNEPTQVLFSVGSTIPNRELLRLRQKTCGISWGKEEFAQNAQHTAGLISLIKKKEK